MGAKYGSRRLPGAIAALTDFQKAQCFFMLAINIAAQVSKHRGNNSPNNLQELYNNNSLIKAISVSGYLPVTFTLLTLHNVGMVSWYLIVLSVLTVAFSVATSVDIGAFAPSPADIAYLETQSHINGTEACGNRNLLVYCLAPPYGYDAESYVGFEVTDNNAINGSIAGGYSTMAFCIIVLLLLIVDQTGWIKKMRKRKADSVLPTSQRFIFDNFFTVRGVQLLLTLLLWVPSTLRTSHHLNFRRDANVLQRQSGWVSSLRPFLKLLCCTYSSLQTFATSLARYGPENCSINGACSLLTSSHWFFQWHG